MNGDQPFRGVAIEFDFFLPPGIQDTKYYIFEGLKKMAGVVYDYSQKCVWSEIKIPSDIWYLEIVVYQGGRPRKK